MAPMAATEYPGLMESQGDRDYRVSSFSIQSLYNQDCFHFSLASLSRFFWNATENVNAASTL